MPTYLPSRVEDGRTITQVTHSGQPRKVAPRQRRPLEGSPANADYEAMVRKVKEWDERYYHRPANPIDCSGGVGGTVNKNPDGSAYIAPSQRVCIGCGYPLKGNKVRNGGEHGRGCYVFNSPKEYGNPYCVVGGERFTDNSWQEDDNLVGN